MGDYLFTDTKFIEQLSTEYRDVFDKLWDEVKYLCKVATAGSKEGRQLEKVKKVFEDAYRAEGAKNTVTEDGVRYALGEYSEVQKNNWENSKRIVVYESDTQLLQFVRDAIADKNSNKKMYFGVINGDLSKRIQADTQLDFDGKNAVLRAGNIRKILLHDHGNVQAESSRGQIAVTETDFLAIKDIFGDPDSIKKEEKGYQGKPAATFEKVIGPKKYTMFVVDSGGSLDIFVQTMFIHKNKGSIANVTNANALISTPTTSVGTAPENNVSQDGADVKGQASLSSDGDLAPTAGWLNTYGKDIALEAPVREDIAEEGVSESDTKQTKAVTEATRRDLDRLKNLQRSTLEDLDRRIEKAQGKYDAMKNKGGKAAQRALGKIEKLQKQRAAGAGPYFSEN